MKGIEYDYVARRIIDQTSKRNSGEVAERALVARSVARLSLGYPYVNKRRE